MDVILLVGIAIGLGIISGVLFQRFKIPQVVGYIVLGLVLGKSVTGIFSDEILESFAPLITFTLGIIGFLIGSELKSEVFRRFGKSIYFILISEGMLAFLLVFAGVTIYTGKPYLGLLFGAIASATDPASTVNVLWEYRSRGPLTTTLTSIVALDDGLALILYGLVSVFSRAMIAHEGFSLWKSVGSPLVELFTCAAIGVVSGLILVKLIKMFKEDLTMPLSLAAVGIVVGISVHFHLDLILTSMTLGATVVNVIPNISERLFKKVKELSTPLYVLFFVFVGAALDLEVFLQVTILSIVLVYLVSRSAGKIFGAMLGGFLSKAKDTVVKYSGLCLFTQGGVAIGLAMSISHNLIKLGPEGEEAGAIIVSVVVATTFVVQLIGPLLVKFGITQADEAGRNVTEEDVISQSKVSDFMNEDFSFIKENDGLAKIMDVVKDRESYHFPVLNKEGELAGIITLGELRSVFREEQLDNFILAKDVALPVTRVLYPDQPLKEAFDIFGLRELDYLPVINDDESKKVVGIVEYRPLVDMVSRKTLEMQESLDRKKS